MRRQLVIGLVALSVVAGCASIRESRFNPLNWFGPSREVTATPAAVTDDGRPVYVLPTLAPRRGYFDYVDARPLVARVTALSVERTTTGAIVLATGIAAAQGAYDVELVPAPSDSPSRLVFDFRAYLPASPAAIGPEGARQHSAARSLSNAQLAGVREIVVRAEGGARSVRR